MNQFYPDATSYSVTAGPATRPVGIADMRRQLRLDDITEEDSYIETLIDAVVADIEKKYSIAMIEQTIVARFPAFPTSNTLPLRLPVGPVSEISSVKYIDEDGQEQTWDSNEYILGLIDTSPYVMPKNGEEYPTGLSIQPDAVRVEYVAGFGSAAANVPQNIKIAIMLAAADLYENREDPVRNMPKASEKIMQSYMPYRF